MFAIYPVTFAPILLAYLARYAFGSQAALFAILGLDAIVGLIVYRVVLDWAVRTADLTREAMIAALSAGDGPIANTKPLRYRLADVPLQTENSATNKLRRYRARRPAS